MAHMKSTCDSGHCIGHNACATACRNEHEVPRGVSRRHVVAINDDMIDAEKFISIACIHCSDAPYMAVCPVDCFYRTEDDVVLHDKDACIGCSYCLYVYPFDASQFPNQDTLDVRGKMDKCMFCADGPGKNGSKEEFEKYGCNRLAERKFPLCAEMYSTKTLFGSDGDVIPDILCNRVMKHGKDVELFGWDTAHGGAQGRGSQAASATPVVPTKPASASRAQS